jgi:LAO/AO transport system kinase
VVRTIATTGTGIEELEHAIDRFWSFLAEEGRLAARREMHWRARVMDMMHHELLRALRGRGLSNEVLGRISREVALGERNPYQLVPKMLEQLMQG